MLRLLRAACLLATCTALHVNPIKSKVHVQPTLGPQLAKTSTLLPSSWATPAAVTLSTAALPVFADENGIPDAVGFVFNILVAGLLVFIAKYAFDFLAEAASQTGERMDRLGLTGGGDGGQQSKEPVYDDTDYSYKDLSKGVENSRTRKKESKQMKADGTRFAPWMVIDEKKVEQIKAQRAKERGRR